MAYKTNHLFNFAGKMLKASNLPFICMYCGDPADQIEHVVPKSYSGENTPKVWSCGECNLIAGAKLFDDIYHKADFINIALRKKHCKVYEMPDWSEDEIAEMSNHMRSYVRGCMVKKEMVRSRITWRCNPTAMLIMKYMESQSKDGDKMTEAELERIHLDRTFKKVVDME